MTNDLNSYLSVSTKQKFAAAFHVVRPISFWVQLARLRCFELGFVVGYI